MTRDAHREQAEYRLGASYDFVSACDKLPDDLMQRVLQALTDLAVAMEGYDLVDANDTGRTIRFWHHEQAVEEFVASNPTAYQPSTACLTAFDRLWSLVTSNVELSGNL